jgi:hypothetical protein
MDYNAMLSTTKCLGHGESNYGVDAAKKKKGNRWRLRAPIIVIILMILDAQAALSLLSQLRWFAVKGWKEKDT